MMRGILCVPVLMFALGCTSCAEMRAPASGAGGVLLSCSHEAEFGQAFSFLSGDWRITGQGMDLDAPLYKDLAEGRRDDFIDDAWTRYVVRPIDMWRYAVAGDVNWRDYTLEFTFRIKRPAPTEGYRAGDSFYNYQWGRESTGSDLGAMVRYRGPHDYYMVRLSSGFDHVELWKTRGGVVRVVPCKFEPNRDYNVSVTVSGAWIVVRVDGKEVMRYLDRIAVIPCGRVGFGVRESRVLFKQVRVRPAALITDKAAPHRPDFRLKRWVGRDYIFDGNEPVGYITELYGPRIAEVKLLPGYMPMMLIELYPLNYSNALKWKAGKVEFTGHGEQFAFRVPLEEEKGRASAVSHFTLRYDAKRGYVWDKQVEMTAKVGGEILKGTMEVTDPFFYQIPIPATDKLPGCSDVGPWAIWSCEPGKYARFPVNHQWCYEGYRKANREIVPGGLWATVLSPGAAAVIELPQDNPYRYSGGYCMWGFDLHIRAAGQAGKKFDEGEVYRGHARYYAWNAGQVADGMLRGTPVSPGNLQLMRFIYEEPVNSFRRLIPLASPHREQLWEGNYTADATMGRGDGSCMRIEGGASAGPNALGPSQWTGPYLAPRYRISAWVKSDELKGKVRLVLNNYGLVAGGPKTEEAELAVDGSTDWKRIDLVTRWLRHSYQWGLKIEVEGEGWAWIDDVEIVPLQE